MLVYKYRGISKIDRDIDTLKNNQYYASSFKDLNDPFENIFQDEITSILKVIKDEFQTDTSLCESHLETIKSFNEKMGIYSLTTSPYNELMWAHYASESKGFCIEYDFDKLKEETNYPLKLNTNCISVVYRSKPPKLNIHDISNGKLLKKLFGAKSKAWEYEDEVRILVDDFGPVSYYPSALKSIYFGYSADDSLIEKVIGELTHPELKFYRVLRCDDRYELCRELIHENGSIKQLNHSEFEYQTKHNPTVENFYIKTYKTFENQDAAAAFIYQFQKEVATKRANIILYDKDVDLSKIRDADNNHSYLEDHKIAEIMIGCDEVLFTKQ